MECGIDTHGYIEYTTYVDWPPVRERRRAINRGTTVTTIMSHSIRLGKLLMTLFLKSFLGVFIFFSLFFVLERKKLLTELPLFSQREARSIFIVIIINIKKINIID